MSGCNGHNGKGSTPVKLDVKLDQLIRTAPANGHARVQPKAPPKPTGPFSGQFSVGLDVGSTTVKAVVVDAKSDEILWQDYQRHETKQPEKVLEFLRRMQAEAGINPSNTRMFVTGSGGGALAPFIGAKFVQEVTAVSLAVEKMHPEVNSVIELGGQDAKIIVFKEDESSGRKKKIPSMNDKCAGGTGAVIDKINAKLKIPSDQLCEQGYFGIKLHPVAGKCGVFAETDINGLQKQGTPNDQLMASLFDAIVLQNLTVLTRGHTLRPHVLLLGGPNSFIRGMREAWQHNIPKTWEERKVQIPEGTTPQELIKVPANAQYFAAIGAVEFGKDEEQEIGRYLGTERLEQYITVGRAEEKAQSGSQGLSTSPQELQDFKEAYKEKPFIAAKFAPGETVRGFVGLDGGSTSTKAVLLSESGQILCKAYQLSNGNPIQDTIDMFQSLRKQVEAQGCQLEILGVGTTGYAKDILKDVLKADVAIVETVAHTESAMRFYEDPHVIVDVGGQDIKLIVLKDGRVKDFKLNTQCSAGNGYFLQSTAEGFGMKVDQYADIAFSAESMPLFGYGCAVFMQSDIVNFQRQGWRAEEILAGLAGVLPKNIFLYVASIPNLAKLGNRFVLQGGTQKNLAAVKSQVDFIRSHFHGSSEPEVIVHEHCGESGAIGAGVEALRLWKNGKKTTFIGLDAVATISYRTTRNENTRCYFCKNNCLRTFIDVQLGEVKEWKQPEFKSKVPLQQGEQRLIISTCEKGQVEDVGAMRGIKAGLDAVKAANPNFVEIASREAFKVRSPQSVADPVPSRSWTRAARERVALMKKRASVRVGIPRLLNIYSYAPLFNAYLESLGVPGENIVYSDYTSPEMYRAGAGRGAIDPCFPSKIGIPHVANLISVKHAKKPLDIIFFPMIDTLTTFLKVCTGSNACPTVTATPDAVKAAFTKENDVFADNKILYLDPVLNLNDRRFFGLQMFQTWAPVLGLSDEENERAIDVGFKALEDYESSMRKRVRETLDRLEAEARVGIVMLGRVYHHDPGVNHEIMDEFQKLGYPVFSQSLLPLDEDLLERLFGDDVRDGLIKHPLDISDVWKNAYSGSTNHKIWAAKFTARHPNLVALEISNFKCGHDAPIYSVIESIIEQSGTPYFSFKDLDENKPAGSIKIRVETIDYFLKRYREDLVKRRDAIQQMDRQLAEMEQRLRSGAGMPSMPPAAAPSENLQVAS
ncbi:MAG: acyl-CoA dehydratase activase-related protein [Acidobacteriales bacterium]|nr:acyl-CoA dehydratase activase-related protein [Terriglobales bacterium]